MSRDGLIECRASVRDKRICNIDIGPRGCGGALDAGVSPGVCSLGSPVLVTSWD